MSGIIESINPATGEVIGRVEIPEDIEERIRKAKEFQGKWRKMSLSERRRLFENLRRAIFQRHDEIARLIAMEQGKPYTEAILAEVLSSLDAINYLIKNGESILRNKPAPHFQPLFSSKKAHYRFEPFGTWAVISPWNYPFAIPFIEISHILFSGNTVVFKPSPITPLVGQKIVELFREAGFPEQAIALVHGGAREGEIIIKSRHVDAVVFTGSVPTGRRIMELASEKPKKVILELGGKDPAIVLPDADIERSADGIVWGAVMNAGQTCASIERVYVHRSIYKELIQAIVEKVKELRIGNPLQDVDMGPMTVDFQLKKVINQLREARNAGAKILHGGNLLKEKGPLFIEPAVLIDVNHSMGVMKEETFGPLIPIMPFDTMEEATELANDSDYGLTASIWTRDREAARRLIDAIQAGVITVNSHVYSFAEPESVWGGVKESGIGRTHGRFGLLETVQIKYVDEDFSGKPEMWWYPYSDTIKDLSIKWLNLMSRPTLPHKIEILTRLIPAIPRLMKHINLPATIWKTLWY